MVEDPTGLSPGTYTVIVTDANGCNAANTVTISEPTPLSTTFETTPSTGNDGTAIAIVTGGAAPYTYQWNNGQTTALATGLVVGSYSVFITDANGCTVQETVEIDMATSLSEHEGLIGFCLLYTSPSPRDLSTSRMPSSA